MRVMFPFQEGEGKFSRFPDIIYYIYDIKDHYMYCSVWSLGGTGIVAVSQMCPP